MVKADHTAADEKFVWEITDALDCGAVPPLWESGVYVCVCVCVCVCVYYEYI